MPRPTRRLARVLPSAGLIALSRISALALHEVIDLIDHSAYRRRINKHYRLVETFQTQTANRGAMRLLRSNDALDQRHFHRFLCSVGHCSHPKISSMVLPRLAATSEGRVISSNPFNVARTTLYGLVEPWHFASTLVTPITSNTARIGPPAIIPVPSEAGCMKTLAAPCRPMTVWCKLPFFNDTLTILRRAWSMAFCTATGTSLALPLPMPIPPSPSPTTVRAAKPRMRPPLTTLVTRLTETIFSRRPSERSSVSIFAIYESLWAAGGA